MAIPLNILIVEDSQDDAELMVGALRQAGFEPNWKRVEKERDFLAEIKKPIDVILSDYSMPQFNGLRAVKLLRETGSDVPFILISGTVGEEIAVDAMKHGTTDYLLKDRIGRLGNAVHRAVREVEERAARRRAEESLRQTEQRLRIIFNESALGIALVAKDGHPVLTNTALQKMLGYTNEELSRMHFQEFTHPDDRAKGAGLFRQLLQGELKSYQLEKRYLRKDGREVPAHLSVSLARGVSGQDDFSIAMVEDVTARRKLEAQFIEAQKMEVIGHLASGVAHDFNNFLGIIISYSDMLSDEVEPGGRAREHNEKIRHAAERAAGLTRQLLVFSRRQAVQMVVLDLNAEVREMEKMLRRLIGENIELSVVPGRNLGRIKGDSGYIGQLLMNLVVNARDAMPDGGKLAVTTKNQTLDEAAARAQKGLTAGDYVLLIVKDTGIGMSDEVKARIFEAFFTTKPKGKGTGLGLATCQTIVQQCGAHIGVDSQPGKGAAFTIYFPRVEQLAQAAARSIPGGPLPRGTEALLVVEDEPALRRLACEVLEGQGYQVIQASNGLHAISVAREHKGPPIRLVITDVIMPEMGGKVMAEWLTTTYPDVKILFTSGYTDEAIASQGVLEAGIDFLSKPYTPAMLAHKVREMLDR
jgi:PAS domain S-box-containing protein